jgi:starch synthase
LVKEARTLMITPDYPPNFVGGCALSCQLLVEGLRSRGVVMDVLAFNGNGQEDIESPQGFTRHLPHSETLMGLNFRAMESLRDLRQHYDIIHVYNCQQIPAAVFYASRHGAKVVATLNNMVPVCTNPSLFDELDCAGCTPIDSLSCALHRKGSLAMRSFMPVHWTQFTTLRRYAKQVDAFIALSEETKRYYVSSGFPEQRIHVIPNMFDPKMQELARTTPPMKRDEGRSIIYVGRLEVEKGLQVLIEALSILDRSDVRLHLVGKGAYEPELRTLAERLDLTDQVKFTGFIPQEQTAGHYRSADVFVHPALWPEPFARTLLESLAFQVPLVVSDNGPSSKILGPACASFRSGDPVDLAEKMEMVLSDPVYRRELQAHGQVVLERFSPRAVLGNIKELYDQLIR